MFDTLRAIWAGLTGKLEHVQEARKLVWLLLLCYLAGLALTAFAAWVSFNSYYKVVSWLPAAEYLSWAVTIMVAFVMFFLLAYLSGYVMERWMGVPAPDRDYGVLGARICLVAAICFGVIDYRMNLQGGQVIVKESAGTVAAPDFTAIAQGQASGIEADRKMLQDLQAGRLGGYGWRDPKTKTYHLNDNGKLLGRRLTASIERQQALIERQAAAAEAEWQQAEADREQYLKTNNQVVTFMVQYVYALMLLICFMTAWMVETIQRLAGTTGKRGYTAPTPQGRGTQRDRDLDTDMPPVGFRPATARTTSNVSANLTRPVHDTPLATDDTGHEESAGGYRYNCTNCGISYVAKRPGQPGRGTFCCDDCRMEYHGRKKPKISAA